MGKKTGYFFGCVLTVTFSLVLSIPLINAFDRTNPETPCLDCHSFESLKAPVVLYDEQYVHAPVAAKKCAACHREDKKDLVKEAMLCFDCHDISKFKGKLYRHPVLEEENYCLSCHEVHASDHKFLLKEEPIVFCQSCHSEKMTSRSHPIGGRIVDPLKNRTMTCTSSCHNMHLSDSTSLLLSDKPELCASCHPDTRK